MKDITSGATFPVVAAPRVGVIVINWNQHELVVQAVRTALASEGVDVLVVIVDNGSEPDSLSSLVQTFESSTPLAARDSPPHVRRLSERVHLLQTGFNSGFTGANNAAFTYLFGPDGGLDVDHAFLLNSDAALEPSTLAKLCAAAGAHTDVGLVGSLILATEDATGATVSFARSSLNAAGMPMSWDKGRQVAELPDTPAIEVELVGGAAMLVPRSTFELIGGQDDRYFFDVDDTEISLRARRAGLKNLLVIHAVTWHAMGSSVRGRTALSRYYNLRNILLLHRTYRRGSYRFWWALLRRVARDFAAAIVQNDPRRARAVLAALTHHAKETYGRAPDWLYVR